MFCIYDALNYVYIVLNNSYFENVIFINRFCPKAYIKEKVSSVLFIKLLNKILVNEVYIATDIFGS